MMDRNSITPGKAPRTEADSQPTTQSVKQPVSRPRRQGDEQIKTHIWDLERGSGENSQRWSGNALDRQSTGRRLNTRSAVRPRAVVVVVSASLDLILISFCAQAFDPPNATPPHQK